VDQIIALNKPIFLSVRVDCSQPVKADAVGIMTGHLSLMFHSGIGSDVKFIVKGEEIPAHSFILQGGTSPVLAAMFEHDMTESSSRTAVVEDIDPKVFRQLLSYVYTGDAPKLEDDDVTEPLFVAADKYQIQSLKDWCSSVLQESITVDNAVRYIVLAHLHSDTDLQDQCEFFIDRQKKVYWERDDFKQLSKTYPDIFYNLCKFLCFAASLCKL